ncbi:MAG: hypothetical protein M0C28_39660 [Candidatus Moduliflexus flocculans]|nr:hypothetical protein [Candidatus Moduliflexus flocculans]
MEADPGRQAPPRPRILQGGQPGALARYPARRSELRFRQALPRIRRSCSSTRASWTRSRKRWPGSSASTPPAASCCSGWPRTAATPSPTSSGRRCSAPCSPRWSATSSTRSARTACAISSSTTRNCSVELIGSADLEVIKDLTRALQFSPVFRRHGQALAAGAHRQELSRHPVAHHRRADPAGRRV